jgi:hypothetical protein
VRTSENANSAKFIMLHRNEPHGAAKRPNAFSQGAPSSGRAADRLGSYSCYMTLLLIATRIA